MESGKEEVSVPIPQGPADSQLDDDRSPQEGHFVGATLKIDGDLAKDEHEVKFSSPGTVFQGPGLDRNRPGSTIGRQSVRSTASRTSLRRGGYMGARHSEKYFCYKVR